MRARAARSLRRIAYKLHPVHEVTVQVDSAPLIARIDQHITDLAETGFVWAWPQ